ncbi:hypothetical protein Q7689_00260 [Nocardiopsis tropica]|uniref:hypothetical protein n=1 Tax=Nocardiopsis tropica TaxID=109330 RepID=UPI002E874B35|nr:hypothetical protein [Nocardiopsis tropica]
MALEMDSWAVEGAQSSSRIARLQLQSGTASRNGVVDSSHLQILPLTVPGTSVRATSGGATILGAEASFQGSYFAFNVGDAEIAVSPTGSGGGRSDLVILRVEDPNISGTPWTHDVTTDPVYYFRVIEGVDPTTTDVPPGTTGVALARLDIPANTATITSGMITDVRQMANPKRLRELRVQRGQGLEDGRDDHADFTSDFERWPQHDWTVTIPEWATQVQVRADWLNVMYPAPIDGTGGNYDARGQVRVGLVGSGGNVINTAATAFNFNATSASNGYRCSIGLAAQMNVPTAMRGMACDLRMYAKSDADRIRYLVADGWANFAVDLEFREQAAPQAEL